MKKLRQINQDLDDSEDILTDKVKVKIKRQESRINKKLKKKLDQHYD